MGKYGIMLLINQNDIWTDELVNSEILKIKFESRTFE